MKLTMSKRVGTKKSEINQTRREGKIPAVLYSPDRPTETITIDGTELSTALRRIESGRLPTTKFVLVDGNKEIQAIIKDIQYHPTSYQVLHVDFVELVKDVPVSVKVPIECTGAADCSGIKLGGFLRQVIRHVKVECAPNKIPEKFEVDVRELGIRQSKRLSDIVMPSGVKPLACLDEVVVVIAKR
jgi:large subunit ribosomal protein L25